MTRLKILPFLIFLGLALGWPLTSRAEGQAQKEFPTAVFLFHLYYDQGQLFADRDFEFKYDILVEGYAGNPAGSSKNYRVEIVGVKNKILGSFPFDPQRGEATFTKGKTSAKAPFFANAQEAQFYDWQNKNLLSVPLSGSSFCNENGICDSGSGEDEKTCPADCSWSTPPPSVSPSPSPSSDVWTDIFRSVLGMTGLMIGIAAAVLGLAIWLVMRWLKNKKNDLPPPQI